MLDPQLKSVLTTIGMTLSTSVAAWAATHGWINASDQGSLANILVSVAGAVVTVGLGWYKARMVSPAAAIAQVNAQDNGVKVVAATEPVPAVSGPLKGGK